MLRRRGVLGLLLVFSLVIAACGDDEAADTTEAPTTTAAPTTTVAVETQFDMVEAVASFTNNIPEGWMAVGDLTAFKDAMTAGAYVIDVRETGEYAEGHIPGAPNIPLRTLGDNLDMIPTDRQVFVYCKSGYRATLAASSLGLLGYDNVSIYKPSWNAWVEAGEPIEMEPVEGETFEVPEIAPEMLSAVQDFLSTIPDGWLMAGDVEAVQAAFDAGAVAIDVRTEGEFADGFIPGAVFASLRDLPAYVDDIPTDTNLVVYCKSGHRCTLAVPVMHVLGFDTARCFTGSWAAWTEAGLEVASA
jgi:rhodanese-related sulfurtransferase